MLEVSNLFYIIEEMNLKSNVLEWKIILVCVFPHLEGPGRTPAQIEYLQ